MAEEKAELGEILRRLEKVERENRSLKCVGGIALLFLAMVFIMGQAKSDRVIEADTVKAGKIFADLIQLTDGNGNATLLMPGFVTMQNDKNVVYLQTAEGPSVQLIDKEGFETDLGVSSLVTVKTGAQSQTSAASVVLFGKDKKVLWSAP